MSTPPAPRPLHKGERVLVCGAAGFVGSHLCELLLRRGCEVLGLDNLISGDLRHLAPLRTAPRFRFLQHDICSPPPPEAEGVARIFNLACPASPAHYQRMPVQTVLASVLGVWQLLELARRSGARLLQASTSEVYGDAREHPQQEQHWGHVNPIGPRACYDEGKRCAEAMLMAYAQQHGTDVAIARLFNTYGPRLRPGDGRVVCNFIVQALRGEPLTLYGDGLQTRSFCYVDDTVRGLCALMDSGWRGPVNLGNPCECTMLELARRVLALTGSRSTLVHRPLPPDDPRRRRPDIGLARQRLGWQPEIGLDEGLARTVAYFRQRLALEPDPADEFPPAPDPHQRPRADAGTALPDAARVQRRAS
ncbi:MAG TPA: GDP-mannose 4,6-dehydratase [Burkholderiaceae bacterium]|nr:GDP-mannose 4,6-dehydratase [Burkholderiaceae bacterium]